MDNNIKDKHTYQVSAPFIILPFLNVTASNEQEALDNFNLVVRELLQREFGMIDITLFQDEDGAVEVKQLE